MPGVVPDRLFFSRLPGDELEFSCIVVLPVAADATISWTLRAADGSGYSLACGRPALDDELGKGRAVPSAALPPGWPDSILTVDAGRDRSVHEVRRFAQRQRFGLPFDSVAAGG